MEWKQAELAFGEASLDGLGELTRDAITKHYSIWQRKRGHRYSLDDLATAYVAVHACPDATQIVDFGCGIGSVLHMLAWRFPTARLCGVEAQEQSARMAHRSIQDNGIGGRTRVVHGDLRDAATAWDHGPVDLVTGTPPYLPPERAVASPDEQRRGARLELRGGVEAYLVAMESVLTEQGVAVLCFDARDPERVRVGARVAALAPIERLSISPAEGRDPLVDVWTFRRVRTAVSAQAKQRSACIRDRRGLRTAFSHAMRHAFGLIPRSDR